MKLKNIKKVGRFKKESTGQEVNIHRGRVVGRSTDVVFYLYRGKRIHLSDRALSEQWKKVPDKF